MCASLLISIELPAAGLRFLYVRVAAGCDQLQAAEACILHSGAVLVLVPAPEELNIMMMLNIVTAANCGWTATLHWRRPPQTVSTV